MTPSHATLCKACVPCHSRKIKCDANETGLPCGRCVARGCSSSCVRALRHPRSKKNDPKRKTKKDQETLPNNARQGSQDDSRPSTVSIGASSTPEYQLHPAASHPTVHSEEPTVYEDHARTRVCHEISGKGDPVSARNMASTGVGRDTVQYRNGFNFISGLGELVGTLKARRLTRVLIHENEAADGGIDTGVGLGTAELNLLEARGALSLPPKTYCDQLLKSYFEFSYHNMTVFNRVEFCELYESGQCSLFLMQAILANAVQYAPRQLIESCGFENRSSAQRAFIARATLLYDLGHETAQLRLLQGSIVLGATVFSFMRDKDFRFWIQNAARIAVKMGLHLRDIEREVDSETFRMCRRIWWAIYSRDIILQYTGLGNMRMLDSNDYDMSPLAEDDWDDEKSVPERFGYLLSPITRQQTLFNMEYVNLTLLGEKCLLILKSRRGGQLKDRERVIPHEFSSWRKQLPNLLKLEEPSLTSFQKLLAIALMAASYRVECIIYHALKKNYHEQNDDSRGWAKERLQHALFELDAFIGRAITHGLSGQYSQTIVGCVNTSTGLHIESSLHQETNHMTKVMDHNSIRQNITFLREIRDLPSVQWSLGMFEWILDQKDLFSEIGLPQNAKKGVDGSISTQDLETESFGPDFLHESSLGGLDPGQQFEDFLFGNDFVSYIGLPDM